MSEATRDRATRLESLLPQILRTIHQPGADDETFTHLTIPQMRVMRILFAGDRSPSELGEELNQSPSATTQMVYRLANLDLIERMEDTEDRRVKHLSLSARGRQFMENRKAHRVGLMESILEKLPDHQQAALMGLLEDLLLAAETTRLGHKYSAAQILDAEVEGLLPPTNNHPRGE